MKGITYLIAILSLCSGCLCQAQVGDSWNISDDWHCEGANPENNWAYGYKTGPTNAFTLYDWATCGSSPSYPYYSYWTKNWSSYVHKNNQAIAWEEFGAHWEPWQTTLWGGAGEYPAFRWTAPENGIYQVDSLFTGNWPSVASVNVYVVVGGNDIVMSGAITGYYYDDDVQNSDYAIYENSLSLTAGQSIDFVVGEGGSIGIDATITLTDGLSAWCNDTQTVFFDGDINKDCYVDIQDLALIANEWVSVFNFLDFSDLSRSYNLCTNPSNDNCLSQNADFIERTQADAWMSEKFSGPNPIPPFSYIYNGEIFPAAFDNGWDLTRTSEILDQNRTKWILQYSKYGDNLIVTCEAIEYGDFPAVEWVLKFRDQHTVDQTYLLSDIQTADFDTEAAASGDFTVYYARGSQNDATYGHITDFEPLQTSLALGSQRVFMPMEGRSSKGTMPYFNISKPGRGGHMFAVGWTGQWKLDLCYDAVHTINIKAGMEATNFVLYAGESVRMPSVFLTFWSGRDRLRGQNQLRRLMLDHYTPAEVKDGVVSANPHGRYSYSELDASKAIEGINNINDNGLSQIEIWAIDAGWYPNSGGTTGWQETGDWDPDPVRYPNGMKPVADAVHAVNRKFSLWFEPERVQEDTDFWNYANSQGWLFGTDGYHRMFNMADPTAMSYIKNLISGKIGAWGIDVYRHDFNFQYALDKWRANDGVSYRNGITEIKYINGLYDYFDALLAEHPGLVIDSCASGGQRLDFEMMKRSLPFWRSDLLYDSIEGIQSQTHGLSYWLPITGYASVWSDTYNSRSAMGGIFGLALANFYPDELLGIPPVWTEASALLDQEVAVKGLCTGDYYPLTSYSTSDDVWVGWQFNRTDLDQGVLQLFRRPNNTETLRNFKFQGLSETATYDLTCVGQSCSHIYRTGAQLMNDGLDLIISTTPGSLIISYTAQTE